MMMLMAFFTLWWWWCLWAELRPTMARAKIT